MPRRLVEKLRRDGLFGIWLSLSNRLPGVEYFLDFSIYRLRFEDFRAAEAPASGLSVRLFDTTAALDDLLRVNEKGERFRKRLESGDRVAIAYDFETPVGYLWLQFKERHVEERFGFVVELDPRDVYDFDSFVLPSQRGKGVLRHMHGVAIEELRGTMEKSQFAAIIELQNYKSIRAYQYMGFERVERFHAYRAFGVERVVRRG